MVRMTDRAPALKECIQFRGKTENDYPVTYLHSWWVFTKKKVQGVGEYIKGTSKLIISFPKQLPFKWRVAHGFPGSEPLGKVRAPWCHLRCKWILVCFTVWPYSIHLSCCAMQGIRTVKKLKRPDFQYNSKNVKQKVILKLWSMWKS